MSITNNDRYRCSTNCNPTLNENRRLKRVIIPLLISGLVISGLSLLFVGIIGKDIAYQITLNPEDFSEFNNIDVFYTRNNQTQSLKANLTSGITSGRLPKDIYLTSIQASKNLETETNIEHSNNTIVSRNFTFEASQNISNIDYYPNRSSYFNSSNNAIGVTNHYKGSESFYCGDVVGSMPNDWRGSNVIIANTFQSHDKVASVQGLGTMNRQLPEWTTKGTLEFWFQTGKYTKNWIMRIGNNSFYGYALGVKGRANNSEGDLCLWTDLTSNFSNSTAIASTKVVSYKNYIIKTDFNTDTGRFNIYLNGTLIYRDEKMESNPNGIGWLEIVNQDASESVYFDAFGWDWGYEEIAKIPYTIGLNQQKWNSYNMEYKYYIGEWLKTYKAVSNLSLSYKFVFPQTCTNTSIPSVSLYNYCTSTYNIIQTPVINNTEYSYIAPLSVSYLNKSSETWTNIQLRVAVNYIGTFEVQLISVNATAGFWRSISEFFYNETESLTSNIDTVNQIVTEQISVNCIINTVNITTIVTYSYGSWNFIVSTTTLIITISRQLIHIFAIELSKQNVLVNSNWGTLGLKIVINSIDINNHSIDIDILYIPLIT